MGNVPGAGTQQGLRAPPRSSVSEHLILKNATFAKFGGKERQGAALYLQSVACGLQRAQGSSCVYQCLLITGKVLVLIHPFLEETALLQIQGTSPLRVVLDSAPRAFLLQGKGWARP